MNLAANLSATAARHGARTAVAHGEAELTYRELDAASARVAGMLRSRGLLPGDRVGVMLGNVPQFAMAYYGVLRMGGVVVPMNPLLKPREVDHYVSDSGRGAGARRLGRAARRRRARLRRSRAR